MDNVVFLTERLAAVEFTSAHENALMTLFNHEANTAELGFKVYTPESTSQLINDYQEDIAADPRWAFRLAVQNRQDGAFIGFANTHRRPGEEWPQIGVIIDASQTRRGYATEIARGLTAMAFSHFGSPLVFAECSPDNVASIAALKRIGYVQTAHREKDFFNGREDVDTLVFEIRRDAFTV